MVAYYIQNNVLTTESLLRAREIIDSETENHLASWNLETPIEREKANQLSVFFLKRNKA